MKNKDKTLNSDAEIIKKARILKALSNPIRLKIVCLLCEQLITVNELLWQIGTTQSCISNHLKLLRKDILSYKKEANRVYYFIDNDEIRKIIALLNVYD